MKKLFVMIVLACAASSTATAHQPQDKPWTVVKTWTGQGMKDTETFTPSGREWRVRWETKNEAFPGAGILQIYVQKPGETADQMVALAANVQGISKDNSIVRSTGPHYLKIVSGNVHWSVWVEEQK